METQSKSDGDQVMHHICDRTMSWKVKTAQCIPSLIPVLVQCVFLLRRIEDITYATMMELRLLTRSDSPYILVFSVEDRYSPSSM